MDCCPVSVYPFSKDCKTYSIVVSETGTAKLGIFGYDDGTGRRICLIDVPGFNDTLRSDLEILCELDFFFQKVHISGASLDGIIYLHPATTNRVQGSSKRILRMLEEICGTEALCRLVLCTTMWNNFLDHGHQYQAAILREKELIAEEDFWGYMLRSGSYSMRFAGSQDSARISVDILCQAYEQSGSITLKIQKELSEKDACLGATSAAKVISKAIDHQILDLEKKLARLQEDANDQVEKSRKQGETATAATEFWNKFEEIADLNTNLQQNIDDVLATKAGEFKKQQAFAHKIRIDADIELQNQYRMIQQLQEDVDYDGENYEERTNTGLEYETRKTGRFDSILERERLLREIIAEEEASTRRDAARQASTHEDKHKAARGSRRDHSKTGTADYMAAREKHDQKVVQDKPCAKHSRAGTNKYTAATYKLEQKLVRDRLATVVEQHRRTRMRILFLDKAIPILLMLGGVACIATGAVIPSAAVIIAPGIGLFVPGTKQLTQSVKSGKKKKHQDQHGVMDKYDISDVGKMVMWALGV